MLDKKIKFLIAISIQIVIIFTIIFYKLIIIGTGTEVILKIEPVDPRSPLRGDYVDIRYDISTIEGYEFGELPRNGDTVYVYLIQSGKFWKVSRATTELIDSYDEIYIKGKVVSGGVDRNQYGGNQNQSIYSERYDRIVNVDYGIEQFFIPEGAGSNFSFWRKDAQAMVKIDDRGTAIIRQIYVDGKKWP